MDEKLTPDLNNSQPEGQTGTPELTWQDATAQTAAATETAEAVAQTADGTAEAVAQTADGTAEAVAQTADGIAEAATGTAEAVAQTADGTAEAAVQMASESMMPTEASGFSADGAVAAQPKKPVGLLVTIGVLVVAIIATVAVFFLNQPPEKAVHKALSTTQTVLNERSAKMMQAMPALNVLNQPAKATKNNFSLTFEGLEITDGGAETAMISNMLKGIGVRGNVVSDPANAILEMDANIGLAETPLVDFYMMMNPDTYAFGMPMCTDTMFSIVPSTLKADFLASPMYADMLKTYEEFSPEYKKTFEESMDTQLDAIQAMLLGQVETLKSTGNALALSEQMNAEMLARINTVYEGATYTKLAKEGALKVYQVELQGAQVRKMIIDLAKYVYLESEIMNSYDNMFTPEMLGGMTYKDMMQQEIIDPLEKNLPELPTTLTIKVDSKKVARSMLIEVTPPEVQQGQEFKVTKLTGDFALGDDQTIDINLDSEAVSLLTDEPIGMKMNMKETFADEKSDTSLDFSVEMGDGQSMTMDLLMAADQQGKLNFTVSMGIDNPYMPMVMKFAMDGGFKQDGDKAIWEYPSIIGSIEETDETGTSKPLGSVTFAYRSEGTPLAGAFTPARPAAEIFKMPVDQLEAEMTKYQTKFNDIMQQFSSLMGGAMGTPEIAPEDMPQETTSDVDQMTPEQSAKLQAYFANMTDEDFEAFSNMSDAEVEALVQEIISQPAA